mgnify:CR=1 FL=1
MISDERLDEIERSWADAQGERASRPPWETAREQVRELVAEVRRLKELRGEVAFPADGLTWEP